VNDLLALCPELEPALDEAREVSAYLWQRGWAERNAGNLSFDVTACVAPHAATFGEGTPVELPFAYPDLAGRYFMVTGTGRRFRDFAKSAEQNGVLLRLDDDGRGFRMLWGGLDIPGFRPTSEFPAHLRVHEFLRTSGAPESVVLHTHPTELVALTHLPDLQTEAALNRTLWGAHPEVKVVLPRGVGLTSYTVPGTEELAQETVGAFRRGHCLAVWALHGCVAISTTIADAFDRIDTANKAARIAMLCRQMGHTAPGLDAAQLAELTRAFDLED
jgi:rhamnulose-1-phosphate aldolase